MRGCLACRPCLFCAPRTQWGSFVSAAETPEFVAFKACVLEGGSAASSRTVCPCWKTFEPSYDKTAENDNVIQIASVMCSSQALMVAVDVTVSGAQPCIDAAGGGQLRFAHGMFTFVGFRIRVCAPCLRVTTKHLQVPTIRRSVIA